MLGRIGMGWAAYQLRWRIVQSLYGRLIETLREYGVVEKRDQEACERKQRRECEREIIAALSPTDY